MLKCEIVYMVKNYSKIPPVYIDEKGIHDAICKFGKINKQYYEKILEWLILKNFNKYRIKVPFYSIHLGGFL